MFGDAARRGKAHLHPVSVWRAQFHLSILPRSLSLPSFSSPPVRAPYMQREATHEISHLRCAHLSHPPITPTPFGLLCPVIQSLSLATNQQPPALLLLSDYCAAVTAVCRFVCIRVIHFLGNISSCAA